MGSDTKILMLLVKAYEQGNLNTQIVMLLIKAYEQWELNTQITNLLHQRVVIHSQKAIRKEQVRDRLYETSI